MGRLQGQKKEEHKGAKAKDIGGPGGFSTLVCLPFPTIANTAWALYRVPYVLPT